MSGLAVCFYLGVLVERVESRHSRQNNSHVRSRGEETSCHVEVDLEYQYPKVHEARRHSNRNHWQWQRGQDMDMDMGAVV